MYSEALMEKIKKVVKTWPGKEGELDSLPIHELINALDQVKCDVANGLKSSDPLIPLMIQNVLNKKLFELATNIQNYPLNNKEKIVQVYLLVRPKIAYNMNKLFVVCERNVKRTKFNGEEEIIRTYNLGVDYMPESGDWGHAHYDATTPKRWEEYIRDEYGMAIPLLSSEAQDE